MSYGIALTKAAKRALTESLPEPVAIAGWEFISPSTRREYSTHVGKPLRGSTCGPILSTARPISGDLSDIRRSGGRAGHSHRASALRLSMTQSGRVPVPSSNVRSAGGVEQGPVGGRWTAIVSERQSAYAMRAPSIARIWPVMNAAASDPR